MPLTGDRKREYQREYLARRRRAWFEGKVCAHCGSADNLELDHIDPATKVSNTIWSWSQVRRDEELAKCQPLCEGCHKVKTRSEQFHVRHGDYQMHKRYGCRCAPCKASVAPYWREYRARKKQSQIG